MAPTAEGDKKFKPMAKKQIAHFEKRLLEERNRACAGGVAAEGVPHEITQGGNARALRRRPEIAQARIEAAG